MRKGGYKIIDLKGVNFAPGTGSTVKGIHSAIESSYNKALLLTGIVVDGVELNDVFFTYMPADSTFNISNIYGYDISITAEDLITFTATTSNVSALSKKGE